MIDIFLLYKLIGRGGKITFIIIAAITLITYWNIGWKLRNSETPLWKRIIAAVGLIYMAVFCLGSLLLAILELLFIGGMIVCIAKRKEPEYEYHTTTDITGKEVVIPIRKEEKRQDRYYDKWN